MNKETNIDITAIKGIFDNLKTQKEALDTNSKSLLKEALCAFKTKYETDQIVFDCYNGKCPGITCIVDSRYDTMGCGYMDEIFFSKTGEIVQVGLQFDNVSLYYNKSEMRQMKVKFDYLEVLKYVIHQLTHKQLTK